MCKQHFYISLKQLHQVLTKYFAGLPEDQKQTDQTHSIETEIKRLNNAWFKYFLTYEPTNALKQVSVPVLVINGELDVQVSSKQNLPVIANALKESGNKDYTILELPKLNHIFQTCQTGAVTEYAIIEETISTIALNTMSDWILVRIKLMN